MSTSGHGQDPRHGDPYDSRGPGGPNRGARGFPSPHEPGGRGERGERGERGGGLPPGWRGDDRRAPSRENYDDRDKYYLDRERDRGGPRDVGRPPKEAAYHPPMIEVHIKRVETEI